MTIKKFFPTTQSTAVTYRKFAKVSPQYITSYLDNCDWSLFSLPDQVFDLDQGLMALTDNLNGAIDHLAPEKTFQPKKLKPPWVDAEIELLMSKRDALHRKYDEDRLSRYSK